MFAAHLLKYHFISYLVHDKRNRNLLEQAIQKSVWAIEKGTFVTTVPMTNQVTCVMMSFQIQCITYLTE